MARQELSQEKFARLSVAVAAGTTSITGTHVDMQGYESVVFTVAMGAITAGAATSIKVQTGDAVGDGDMADYGTALTVADNQDDGIFVIEVVKPLKRYVRPVVVRGTQDAVLDSITSLQYNGRHEPAVQDTTVKGKLIIYEPVAS